MLYMSNRERVTIDEDEDSCANASDEQMEHGEGDDVQDYEKGRGGAGTWRV